MTSQEEQMIQGLIDRVNQTQLPDKDRDAERLLQQSLGRNPDSIYILSQTVLVQDYALQQAQRQLAALRSELDEVRQQQTQPQQHTSFLGSLLGRKDNPAPPPPPPPARIAGQPSSDYQPTSSYGQPQAPAYAPVSNYAPGPPAGFGAPAGGGGFLRGAMQTAAGVAAGALAFQGIESLMHGFGGSGGYGAADLGGFGGGAPREEVINNYYGDSGDRDRGDRQDFDTAADNNGTLSPDLEDRRFDESGNTQGGDDTAGFDDSADSNSFDDGSMGGDEGGGFGDGGDFGDGGGDSNFS